MSTVGAAIALALGERAADRFGLEITRANHAAANAFLSREYRKGFELA